MSEIIQIGAEVAKLGPAWLVVVFVIVIFGVMGRMIYKAFETGRTEHAIQIKQMFDQTNEIQKEVREESAKRDTILLEKLSNIVVSINTQTILFAELKDDVRDLRRNAQLS